jgi:tRNA modification GTPase
MLNYERAIVTDVKGTTRDIIEETYLYNGAKFVLTDTAGVRDSNDLIEKIGIDKAKKAINFSDIILFVVDGSQKLSQEDLEIINLLKNKKVITIVNKSDLPQNVEINKLLKSEIMFISALNKNGINDLKQKIYYMVIDENVASSNLMITNLRHIEVLNKASQFLFDAINSLNNKMSLDLVSIDIKNLWQALGEITGETNNEEIINRIFSSFCVGK